LIESQYFALCKHLNILDELDISLKPLMIRNAANSIIYKANPEEINPPLKSSDRWIKRFLQRHPEYKVYRRQTLEISRKKAHQPGVILGWF
jgi:hypothetical protein